MGDAGQRTACSRSCGIGRSTSRRYLPSPWPSLQRNMPRPPQSSLTEFEADGLKRQNLAHAKIGNLAKAHRQLLEDCGHRQARLLDSTFHGKRPAAVGVRRLCLFPLELLPEGKQKRLRDENETFTGPAAHRQREARRRAKRVALSECVNIAQRREALKRDREGRNWGKGSLERASERASEFFDERCLDRR